MALWVNWFLVCQLPAEGLLALLAYVAFAAAHYACYGAQRSVGNCTGWSTILLAAAAASARASPDRCVALSADDLENSLMIRDDVNVDRNGNSGGGNASTGFLPPSAEQPLLAPEEEDDSVPGGPGAGSAGGGSVQTLSATSSHDQLVRRRSSDANAFRSAML